MKFGLPFSNCWYTDTVSYIWHLHCAEQIHWETPGINSFESSHVCTDKVSILRIFTLVRIQLYVQQAALVIEFKILLASGQWQSHLLCGFPKTLRTRDPVLPWCLLVQTQTTTVACCDTHKTCMASNAARNRCFLAEELSLRLVIGGLSVCKNDFAWLLLDVPCRMNGLCWRCLLHRWFSPNSWWQLNGNACNCLQEHMTRCSVFKATKPNVLHTHKCHAQSGVRSCGFIMRVSDLIYFRG